MFIYISSEHIIKKYVSIQPLVGHIDTYFRMVYKSNNYKGVILLFVHLAINGDIKETIKQKTERVFQLSPF